MSDLQVRVDELERQNQELRSIFDSIGPNMASATADMDRIRQDHSKLRGSVEELGHELDQFKKSYQDITPRVESAERRLSAIESKLGIKTDTTPAETPQQQNQGPNEMELLKEADNLFRAGNYEAAKARYTEFLKKHPNSSSVPDAQFMLGECFFEQRAYDSAILEYDKVVTRYSSSPRAPRAYLKLGFSFYELGEMVDARIFFEKVIKDYPGTEEAELAKKKLDLIR
ncbi:MAG: tol-pal system protein YbgF [Candidatus Alcyoniella australis]|nr:tol-pal system protein YbgF [Candidatus Alcyoniella australis]